MIQATRWSERTLQTCRYFSVVSQGAFELLSVLQLVFLSDVIARLVLLTGPSPAFLMRRCVGLCAGCLLLAVLKSVRSRPPSWTAGWLAGSRWGWRRNCGGRHGRRWRRRGCKAPEVKPSIISSPSSSPQPWEGGFCCICFFARSERVIEKH